MIHKLEQELDVKIFDRAKKPIRTTEEGKIVLAQARKVLQSVRDLREAIKEHKGIISGEIKVGLIPTLAPYLVPMFIRSFLDQYPSIKLVLSEHTTSDLVEGIKRGRLDVGIIVTPLQDPMIVEEILFYEELMYYSASLQNKQFILPEDIDPAELWLLEEGHCLRSQILNLCELRKRYDQQFSYQAGSLETLIRMIDQQEGGTIIPELAAAYLDKTQKKRLKHFHSPAPVREVSMVSHRHYVKKRLTRALKDTILQATSHLKTNISPLQIVPM